MRIGRGCSLLQSVQLGNDVCIDNYSYVNYGTLISSGVIGKFTSIGPYCMIGLPDHPLTFLSTSPRTYGAENVLGVCSEWNEFGQRTSIGNDVWIGAMCFIKQGVHIGDGAVIAAGAVVVKDVSPFEIVAGVPARHIRFRFQQAVIDQLLATPWWDRPVADLATQPALFGRADWQSHWGERRKRL